MNLRKVVKEKSLNTRWKDGCFQIHARQPRAAPGLPRPWKGTTRTFERRSNVTRKAIYAEEAVRRKEKVGCTDRRGRGGG